MGRLCDCGGSEERFVADHAASTLYTAPPVPDPVSNLSAESTLASSRPLLCGQRLLPAPIALSCPAFGTGMACSSFGPPSWTSRACAGLPLGKSGLLTYKRCSPPKCQSPLVSPTEMVVSIRWSSREQHVMFRKWDMGTPAHRALLVGCERLLTAPFGADAEFAQTRHAT